MPFIVYSPHPLSCLVYVDVLQPMTRQFIDFFAVVNWHILFYLCIWSHLLLSSFCMSPTQSNCIGLFLPYFWLIDTCADAIFDDLIVPGWLPVLWMQQHKRYFDCYLSCCVVCSGCKSERTCSHVNTDQISAGEGSLKSVTSDKH